MGVISNLKTTCKQVGIEAVISNSKERIETQLNKVTGIQNLPIMLVSWDMESTMEFDDNGFLKNPNTNAVILLMGKATDLTKENMELKAEEMADLFQVFIQKLNANLVKYNRENGPSVTGINYTLAPMYGSGKHSGVLGRFSMIDKIINC